MAQMDPDNPRSQERREGRAERMETFEYGEPEESPYTFTPQQRKRLRKLGIKQRGDKWVVYNTETGRVLWQSSSREKAQRKRMDIAVPESEAI